MSRAEQINDLLREKLANLISREIPLDDGMITITYVDCSPDLKNAKIGFSVIPQNKFGTALEKLKKHNSFFAKTIKKETRLRQIPRFRWVVDETEKNAEKIEKILAEIRNEDK